MLSKAKDSENHLTCVSRRVDAEGNDITIMLGVDDLSVVCCIEHYSHRSDVINYFEAAVRKTQIASTVPSSVTVSKSQLQAGIRFSSYKKTILN